MQGKPKVLVTRDMGWRTSDRLDLIVVPITGRRPPIKKTGKLAGDSPSAAAMPDGIEAVVRALREHRPDFMVRWINTKMPKKNYARFREASPTTRVMCCDGNNPNELSSHFVKCREFIDIPMLNSKDEKTIAQYRDFGYERVGTFYEGFNPREHGQVKIRPDHDCFFGGSNRRRQSRDKRWHYDFPGGEFRFRLMVAVADRFKLLLHGNPYEWPFKARPTLQYPEYYKAFGRAKVVIGCNTYDLRKYYTRRFFHSGASGKLFLTKHIPGIEEDFEVGKHLVTFRTVREALDRIGHYLKNGKERERIAKAGREFFVRNHSWGARLRQFEDFILGMT